ncbi:MAG TPA: cytochrome b/b6 domain-containing protein [Casimicrobiaceae bacterium]|nr:cytochrome b/b6 domain-containing protein [Casimicrobiaceae bacterium]
MDTPTPSLPPDPSPPGAAASAYARVPVWDLPVRLVHWAIVLLLTALIITGKLGNEWLEWHMLFGKTMLVLVVFRVIWGFVGSHNARFVSFLRGPRAAAGYARSLVHPPLAAHATHNPLGGWMAVVLLVALTVQSLLGLFTNDDALWSGPFSERVAKTTTDDISTVHRQFWWVIVALSVIHIGAVLAYLKLGHNLVMPMLTGDKELPAAIAHPEHSAASTAKATALLLLCWLAVWLALNRL